ncbi:Hypothetical_protein [Hexamita inflata]|uniref:Hypothetical_protein n=1 Tax=Hexamita inflata TaxID=28002 RepID=A0AA86QCD9_9EUKA|nr:Hypothetical protein HINF_LOCUS40028 [Hexamita inflata]
MLQAVKRANLISFSNNILVNNSVFTYGQKSLRLNTVSVDNDLYVYKESAHLFLYTEHTQQTHINVKMNHVNVFAVFGFNIVEAQKVIDSNISILINFEVIIGALLCISCDIQVYNSTLVFQASGRQISGVMIQSISNIQLVSTSLQFRFNSSQTSGIVNMVNSSLDKFELSACKLIGTNLQSSENNGYISSSVFQSFTLTLNSVQVCVNGTNRTGANSSSFVQIGTTDPRCDICQTGSVVYGLCLQELHFGTLHDGMLQCIFPFEFVNDECRCAQGFLLNVSTCINIMDNLLSNFDSNNNSYVLLLQQLENNITQQIDYQDRQYEMLDQNIYKNSSLIYNQILNNSNTFDQQLLNNITQIYNDILLQNKYIQDNSTGFNNIIQQLNIQINSINQSSLQCNSNNSSIIINNSTNNYTLNTQNNISNNIYTNITINDTYIHENMIPCDQPVYATSFDIASVTHPVGPASFAGGYAIASGANISNAFIDVQDNAYATVVYPLFQNQSSFTNIKIQIGTQVAGAGSLLSTSPTLAINQVNIVSKDGSQITVNATFKLSILAQSTTSVIASDLLLNLSFSTATQGNISLIESATGVFNVTGFQVLGTYQSQGCVALGANTANTSAVIMNNVSFAPSAFNVGNQSSYLFTKVNSSQIKLTNVTVKLGNSSHPAMSNFVFVTAVYYYQFGGLVSQMNSTNLQVSDISYDCKQIYKIYYIQQSGLLVGLTNNSINLIQIQRTCISFAFKSISIIQNFGLFGNLQVQLHIQKSNIMMNIISADSLTYVGIVGYQYIQSVLMYYYSLKVNVNINQNTGSYVGALVGFNQYPNCTILNSSVQNTNMNASSYSGGFMGYSLNSNVFISHCSIFNSSIMAVSSYSGGFIGYAHLNITIQNSSVQNSNFSKKSYQAGFVGCLKAGSILLISIGQVFNSNIRGADFSGAFVGCTDSGSYVTISDGLIFNNSIIATTQIAGGFIGATYNTYNVRIVISKLIQTTITTPLYYSMTIGYVTASTVIITTSVSEGDNFINGVKQQNCLNYVC